MKPVRSYLEPLFGVLVAVCFYAILGKVAASLLWVFNPFSWVVLYFGLTRQEVFGAVAGTVCGLLQDSLSVGVFGVSGLTKTLMGYGAGFISRKINVAPVVRNFVFLLILSSAELAVWKTLAFSLLGDKPAMGGGLAFLQPAATALIVAVLFKLGRRARGESS
jgi:rod shape-determining protein MreD